MDQSDNGIQFSVLDVFNFFVKSWKIIVLFVVIGIVAGVIYFKYTPKRFSNVIPLPFSNYLYSADKSINRQEILKSQFHHMFLGDDTIDVFATKFVENLTSKKEPDSQRSVEYLAKELGVQLNDDVFEETMVQAIKIYITSNIPDILALEKLPPRRGFAMFFNLSQNSLILNLYTTKSGVSIPIITAIIEAINETIELYNKALATINEAELSRVNGVVSNLADYYLYNDKNHDDKKVVNSRIERARSFEQIKAELSEKLKKIGGGRSESGLLEAIKYLPVDKGMVNFLNDLEIQNLINDFVYIERSGKVPPQEISELREKLQTYAKSRQEYRMELEHRDGRTSALEETSRILLTKKVEELIKQVDLPNIKYNVKRLPVLVKMKKIDTMENKLRDALVPFTAAFSILAIIFSLILSIFKQRKLLR